MSAQQRWSGPRRRRARLVASGCALCAFIAAGCGEREGTSAVPAPADSQRPSATDTRSVTAATTATTPPGTVRPPTTTITTTIVPATAAPTVVETLPQPAAPPDPRADEPYVELGSIGIPAIDVVAPLLEGISLNTLDRGPGHWPGTAMPGRRGNVVVAGHRTSHGKVFRHLDRLAAGDEVIFTSADGRFVYLVTDTVVVEPDAVYIVEQTPAFTATLFACHPPGSTRQRIVVHLALQR